MISFLCLRPLSTSVRVRGRCLRESFLFSKDVILSEGLQKDEIKADGPCVGGDMINANEF